MTDDGSLTPRQEYERRAREFAVKVLGIETDCKASMGGAYRGVESWPPEEKEWRRQMVNILKSLSIQAGMTEEEHFDFLRRIRDELRVRFEG